MAGLVLKDFSWLFLVALFFASLLTVLTWLVQYSLGIVRRRGRKEPNTCGSAAGPGTFPAHQQALGVWGSLLKLGFGRDGGRGGAAGGEPEAGVKGLLSSLFAFKSFRESWQRTWVRALNEQACRNGSSIQITFEDNPQLPASASISHVTCTDQSKNTMVLQCHFTADTVTFPVTVTQQSPAAVSMDTYQVAMEPLEAQVLSLCPAAGRGVSAGTVSLEVRVEVTSNPAGNAFGFKGVLTKASQSNPLPLCDKLGYLEPADPRETHPPGSALTSLTPTKKIERDRTVMPDGTIVTTVTTTQSRPKLDHKLNSPSHSPSKVEVTERRPTLKPGDYQDGVTPTTSTESQLSNGLDPVAETAIRQLTESASKAAKKTPTKRSTLIISGVSKRYTDADSDALILYHGVQVPIAEDDTSVSIGYAAAMDAALQGEPCGTSGPTSHAEPPRPTGSQGALQQDTDETTQSDISERPSVDDVESETGSTGALETRSLKDHKVGFLRSGTKLLFRRRHRQKDPGCSQSHEDVSNVANSSAVRKKSGSFSRRLIKRFSFRSKSKGKASANGGAEGSEN
ncbi:UNVERIFIED_CONTAM: hypothetical protein FKN15_046440 [Acipenser sinensis]